MVETASSDIHRQFDHSLSELLVLASHSEWFANDPNSRRALSGAFTRTARVFPYFQQLRLIDTSGMEVVRVDTTDGVPVIVPADKLQNKASRYYFIQGMALKPGEVYASPMDLNEEDGEIERPLRPMIRFVTPALDSTGRMQGLLVANFSADVLLQNVAQHDQDSPARLMLLNNEGYWLYSRKGEDAWGFQLPHGRRFAAEYADAWSKIHQSPSGQFKKTQGLFTYQTVSNQLLPRPYGKAGAVPVAPEWKIVSVPHWYMVSLADNELLLAKVHSRGLVTFSVILLALLLLVPVSRAWGVRGAQNAYTTERFRAAFQNSPVGIVEANPADSRLLIVNPAFCAMVGYDKSDLLGRSLAEFTHPDDRLADQEGLRALSKGEIPFYQTQKRYIHKLGRIVWVEVMVSLARDAEGKPLHTVAVIADITRQRELEAAAQEHLEVLSQLQRLHTADELATLLAHELNQPLAAIAIYTEASLNLLEKNDGALDPGLIADSLKRIKQQALRAGESIRHLRAFVSRGKLDPQPIDLNQVLLSACELIEAKMRARNIQLILELDASLPQVMGVEVHIEQVLLNLLRNAVEAIDDAGLPDGRVTVTSLLAQGMAQVSVRDTGPGIDAEQAARLFEPLESTKPDGLGVGLRISRNLIEAQQGRLWVEPHTPGGIFHFLLPLSRSST